MSICYISITFTFCSFDIIPFYCPLFFFSLYRKFLQTFLYTILLIFLIFFFSHKLILIRYLSLVKMLLARSIAKDILVNTIVHCQKPYRLAAIHTDDFHIFLAFCYQESTGCVFLHHFQSPPVLYCYCLSSHTQVPLISIL